METTPLKKKDTIPILFQGMNRESGGINEMDEHERKKSRKYKGKRPTQRKLPANGGMLGGGIYRSLPPPAPRRDYGYKSERNNTPKEERTHWNGKAETWTEPQKPRQEKIVKYEVDTDKLLRELAKGNKDALNEITEKLEREIKSESTEETETPKKIDDAEKSTDESANEVSEETNLEARKQTDESTEQAETDLQNENLKAEKSENETEAHEDTVAGPQPENVNDGSQEIPQDTEPETENDQQEDPLDAPELVYMNPSFWEQLESEMSDELEKLGPEGELEVPPEESEPFDEEGY
jgi:hypothetical protein